MNDPIKAKKAQIAPLMAATFPEYKGRTFEVIATDSVLLYDLNWSGGSRSQYRATTLTGTPLGNTDRYNAMAPWDRNQIEGTRLPLLPGAAVVCHSIFCGQDCGLTFYIHPDDMPRLLGAPQ